MYSVFDFGKIMTPISLSVPELYPQDRYVQVGQIRTRFWCLGDEGAAVVVDALGLGRASQVEAEATHVAVEPAIFALTMSHSVPTSCTLSTTRQIT